MASVWWSVCGVVVLMSMPVAAYNCSGQLPPEGCTCQNAETLFCTSSQGFPVSLPPGVTELLMDNVDILTIPKLQYPGLLVLVVEKCRVSDIVDGAFEGTPNLETLEISGNKLQLLNSPSFSGLNKLTYLNLQDNELSEALQSGVLQSFPNLNKLNLDGNKDLTFTESSFEKVNQGLALFSCIGCGMTGVPTNILRHMPNLKILHLNRNTFTTLTDGPFSDLGLLQELHLDSCQIEKIESSAFDGLKKLRHLVLSNNKLMDIPADAFDDVEQLEDVSLNNNLLATLDKDLLNWKQMKQLNLAINEWQCNCDMAWIQDVTSLTNTNHTRCKLPPESHGKAVLEVIDSLSCDEGSSGSTIALAIAIPVIIVCVFLIGYYVYKIIQARKKKGQRKSVRYSAVYRDTTESKQNKPDRPTSEL